MSSSGKISSELVSSLSEFSESISPSLLDAAVEAEIPFVGFGNAAALVREVEEETPVLAREVVLGRVAVLVRAVAVLEMDGLVVREAVDCAAEALRAVEDKLVREVVAAFTFACRSAKEGVVPREEAVEVAVEGAGFPPSLEGDLA